MINVLAAEGGYQVFHLRGSEKLWLLFSGLTALLAIAVGFYLMKSVLADDPGTPKMIEIAMAIQDGALAYLQAPVQDHRRDPHPARRPRLPHLDQDREHHDRPHALSLRRRPGSTGRWPSSPGASCPA